MATILTTTSRKFYNIFQNGDSLTGSPLDFTTNLIGFADERVKVITEVIVETFIVFSQSNPATMLETAPASGVFVFTINSGDWAIEGFSVADAIQIDEDLTGVGTSAATGIIDSLDGNQMIFTVTSGSLADAPANPDNGYTLRVNNLQPLEALKYSYGINSNDEEYNNINKTTGANQTFYTGNIGLGSPRSTAIQAMIPIDSGINNDWHSNANGIGEICEVRFVSESVDLEQQKFEITHVFRITPAYIEGQLSNLQNKVAPALFAGDASLKYAVQYDWRTILTNPNTSKKVIDGGNKGSVGWREESLNGYTNHFSVESVVYTDDATGLPADGVLRSGTTKVVIRVRKLHDIWLIDRIGVIIKTLVPEDEYTNTLTTYDQNFILDDIYYTLTAPTKVNPVGANLVSLRGDIDGGDPNVLEYTTYVTYNAGQQTRIDEDTYYELDIVAGTGLTTNLNTDKVCLIADVNTYDVTNDIPNLLTPFSMKFYDESLPVSTGTGYTSFAGWNYDNLAVETIFNISLNNGAFINSINMLWIAFDPATNEYWEVQNYAIQYDETQVGAIQQLSLDSDRGFNLEDDSDFNNVKVTTGIEFLGQQIYTVQVPFNVDWRDWQPDLNADTIFYDIAELNDNLNKKSSNYSNLNGYELRFGLLVDMSGTAIDGSVGQTDYLILSPDCPILDEDLPVDYTSTIETFTEDGLTNLNGAIKDTGNTLFKTTFTQVSGPFTDLANHWATHKIEDVGQLGNDVDKLSTENFQPTTNKLNPVAGEALLKKELIAGDIVTSCLIDGSLVDSAQNLIARLGTKDNVPVVLPDGKLTTGGDSKETTTSDLKEQA
jgi:hypothetical protein